MSADAFFDTNILVYAFVQDDVRTPIAEGLLAQGGVVSVQVLNEFATVARRKLDMPWSDVRQALSAIRTLCDVPLPVTLPLHEAALTLSERYGYRVFDCLILAAAQAAGCSIVYSEDMQNGQQIDAVTIRNPFL